MTDDERWSKLIDILKEIKLLTGAILHTGDDLKFQVMIIERFLISSPRFASLSTKEILHAFYLNSQGEYGDIYRHYNRELNAEFIGDVLLAYLRYKDGIYSRTDVKALIDPPKAIKKVFVTEGECLMMIQKDYMLYKQGLYEFIYCALPKYNLLRKIGFIEIYSRDYWNRCYVREIQKRRKYGAGQPANRNDRQERLDRANVAAIYNELDKGGILPPSEHRLLIQSIRKTLYFKFFDTIASCGINDIFNEIAFNNKLTH